MTNYHVYSRTGVKIAVTEAEAENMNNDEESDSEKASVILEELNAKMEQLRSLNIQVADFEKVSNHGIFGFFPRHNFVM